MKITFLFLIVCLFMVGCEATTYAPGFSEKHFHALQIGMSVEEVRKLIGDPFQCYLYSKHAGGKPTETLFETVPIQNAKKRSYEDGKFLVMEYSHKKNPRPDYFYASVTIQKGEVSSFGNSLITE